MKKKEGILQGGKITAAAWALAMVVCAGCGASDKGGYDMAASNGYSQEAVEDGYDYSYDMEYYEAGGGLYEGGEPVSPESAPDMESPGIRDARKLIETVTLEVETKEFEQMMSVLELQIQGLGGYIENMSTYNGSRYSGYNNSRYASMTIRVPRENLKGFLEKVSDAGNIVRRSDTVEDVTLSYVDMESRRNTLRTEQARLLEFLDKAETIEEIITIEERLSNVRYQLESMESKLRVIDNLVDYSTVYLNVSEVRELTPIENPTVWERITEGFGDSLCHIAESATDTFVWFLVNIPYILLWGAVLAAVIIVLRRRRKRLVQKKEALKQEKEALEQNREASQQK